MTKITIRNHKVVSKPPVMALVRPTQNCVLMQNLGGSWQGWNPGLPGEGPVL